MMICFFIVTFFPFATWRSTLLGNSRRRCRWRNIPGRMKTCICWNGSDLRLSILPLIRLHSQSKEDLMRLLLPSCKSSSGEDLLPYIITSRPKSFADELTTFGGRLQGRINLVIFNKLLSLTSAILEIACSTYKGCIHCQCLQGMAKS